MKTILAIASMLCLTGMCLLSAEPAPGTPAHKPTAARYVEVSVENTNQTLQLEPGLDYVIHFVNADTSSAPFSTLFLSETISSYVIQKYPELGVVEMLARPGTKANGFLIAQPQPKQKPVVLQIAINAPAAVQNGPVH